MSGNSPFAVLTPIPPLSSECGPFYRIKVRSNLARGFSCSASLGAGWARMGHARPFLSLTISTFTQKKFELFWKRHNIIISMLFKKIFNAKKWQNLVVHNTISDLRLKFPWGPLTWRFTKISPDFQISGRHRIFSLFCQLGQWPGARPCQ